MADELGPSPLPLGAPQGAPMSVPNPKEGMQAKARVDIQQALQLLKKNLNPDVFPVHGPEWKSLDSAIKGLAKVAGEEQGKEIGQAGLKLIASAQSPKGLGGIMGGGGGAPGGMPMGGPGPMPFGGM